MSSVPFSIRLPSKLVDLIDAFAKKTGKSTPDAVRSVIEQSVSNEYRILVVDCLKQPRNVLQRIRTKLAKQRVGECGHIETQDYSALMTFLHWAYMTGEGYANPEYVLVLLDITAALLTQMEKLKLCSNFSYFRSKLDIKNGESFSDGIERVKVEFMNNPSVGWAEVLTRPLEGMADDLQHFDRAMLRDIFDSRIEQVLPVAVRGAKASVDDDIIARDMQTLLPQATRSKINGLSVKLSSHPMAIVTEEGHHCYAFQSESVLSFATAIAGNVFDRMLDNKADAQGWLHDQFTRTTLQVHSLRGEVVIHENGGYRLILKEEEFKIFVSYLKENFESPAWVWLLNRHRELRGDY